MLSCVLVHDWACDVSVVVQAWLQRGRINDELQCLVLPPLFCENLAAAGFTSSTLWRLTFQVKLRFAITHERSTVGVVVTSAVYILHNFSKLGSTLSQCADFDRITLGSNFHLDYEFAADDTNTLAANKKRSCHYVASWLKAWRLWRILGPIASS